ncbi:MAG: Asp-tRNA(Asn)/Glu-tRNA(Gln) amidotransferase GatCAB subunit B, partial [Candidatus Omnitrophota bacterium]
ALEYEVERQAAVLEEGGKLVQETRLWDPDREITNSMRSKEEAQDYRYFPEPDLVPFVVEKKVIDEIRSSLPELPETRLGRFMKEYALSEYDANVLTGDIDTADYFEETARQHGNAKTAANWIMGDIMAALNAKNAGIKDIRMKPGSLAGLLSMIDKGVISGKMAKEVLADAVETGRDPREIVESKGLSQISDLSALETVVGAVLQKNEKSVTDYKSGKKNALAFLIGQIMKETKGKANPAVVNTILKKNLGE